MKQGRQFVRLLMGQLVARAILHKAKLGVDPLANGC